MQHLFACLQLNLFGCLTHALLYLCCHPNLNKRSLPMYTK